MLIVKVGQKWVIKDRPFFSGYSQIKVSSNGKFIFLNTVNYYRNAILYMVNLNHSEIQ